ncbi:MAG: transaldolase [Campylobacterota bacterium]|nr:transaldolase [Campylobacterota bacterium]
MKFSLWADFIERDFITTGLRAYIKNGVVNGATSNPAIFKNAILTSPAYKEQLASLTHLSAKEKYEAVAIYDIQAAADELLALFDAGDSGYVSIEVDPFLCDDAEATIEEAKRLYAQINRPNVMIKVPATTAGYIAMEELTALNIAVNATLIFKKEQAVSCAEAFKRGMQKSGQVVDTVISIFVSRIDRALDVELGKNNIYTAKAGIYNASQIYEAIESRAIPSCRALFASTGVKGDVLNPSYYIEEMLAFNSVNTAPLDAIDAYIKSNTKSKKLPIAATDVQSLFSDIDKLGIDFDAQLQTQIDDGLEAFKDAFQEILDALQ